MSMIMKSVVSFAHDYEHGGQEYGISCFHDNECRGEEGGIVYNPL